MARLLTLSLLLLLAAVPAADARVPKGPGGAAFYTPPAKIPAKHGKLIRARRLTGAAVPPGGSKTELMLYSVKGVAGEPVAVSGTITYPKGKRPRKGWPVITYAHGTTGIADQCAPSRLGEADGPTQALSGYAFPLFKRWLRAGWAVARTDYEGLGTPGVHPYLVGSSEGQATLDAVLAARKVNRRKVVISGHSQGGHAALWANALAKAYAPRLKARGTLAFAPASHLDEQAQALSALKQPSGLSGLAATILRGVEVQDPSLNILSLLSPRAAELYPLVDTECLPAVAAPEAFGAIAPADLPKPYADISAVVAALRANDPEDLNVRGPLRIEQGDADTTVFPAFTDQTVAGYRAKGVPVAYAKRAGIDHGGIVTDASVQRAATRWIAKRLG